MMNNLTRLFDKARSGLSLYERTPEAALKGIAHKCKRDEIAAIHIRIKMLKAEREMTPEWDGDTQDLIWDAIEEHQTLLRLINSKKTT